MIKNLLIIILCFYKYLLSPFLISSCRFYPSCSDYAVESLNRYGIINGSFLCIKRILKCQPFYSKAKYDPVP